MLQVKKDLLAVLAAELEKLSPGAGSRAAFETPKVAAHGDYAVTAAMQLAKPLKANPRALGEQLKAALEATPAFAQWVDAIEIAGPGFLNLRLKPAAKQQVVQEVLSQGERFGMQPQRDEKIIVEFVSANPTGPLHVGHARQAALGDALCRLYDAIGWDVTREFYYNDAGNQIENLAISVQARARGLTTDSPEWPADGYKGDYIVDIARDFQAGKTLQASDGEPVTATGNIDSLDVGEKLLLSTLLVVSLSRDTDSDSVGNALDTTLPELLVQLGVESNIRSTELLLGKVLDGLDSARSSLLELDTENLEKNYQ